MDGLEAMRRIRRELPSTRVLILTSSVAPSDVEGAREAGAIRYLTKDQLAFDLAETVVAAAAPAPWLALVRRIVGPEPRAPRQEPHQKLAAITT